MCIRDSIRFGSRLPVTLPERIYGDSALLDMFESYARKKAVVVVTQFNHPRELTAEAKRAIDSLLTRGIQLRNQTVLLRGVNDKPEVLGELLRGLTAMNVAPYYIFQCRPVTGVKGRFQVPIAEGIGIVDGAKAMQSEMCIRDSPQFLLRRAEADQQHIRLRSPYLLYYRRVVRKIAIRRPRHYQARISALKRLRRQLGHSGLCSEEIHAAALFREPRHNAAGKIYARALSLHRSAKYRRTLHDADAVRQYERRSRERPL